MFSVGWWQAGRVMNMEKNSQSCGIGWMPLSLTASKSRLKPETRHLVPEYRLAGREDGLDLPEFVGGKGGLVQGACHGRDLFGLRQADQDGGHLRMT